MNRRQYKKKSLNEFHTARINLLQPISSITTQFRYGDTQESLNLHYVSRLMNKSNTRPDLNVIKDKYRMLGGKLHIYSISRDMYLPIERNTYIDIIKHSERIKNDHAKKIPAYQKDSSIIGQVKKNLLG